MRALPAERYFAAGGRAFLFALFAIAAFFAARQFAATVEQAGGPAPLILLSAGGVLAPQASERLDSACGSTLDIRRTAESLRYCGLANLVARPDATDAERAERYGRAVGFLEESLDRSPFSGITWLYLTAAHLAVGDREAAAESFDASYEVAPIAVGMQGMRLGIGLSMVEAMKPITLMGLDAEIIMLGRRNPRYLFQIAQSTNQLRYVASALTADLQIFARFMRIVREPPPGIPR
jgi:hypothetical protein